MLIPCHAFIDYPQMDNINQFSLLTHLVFPSSSRDSTSHLSTLEHRIDYSTVFKLLLLVF